MDTDDVANEVAVIERHELELLPHLVRLLAGGQPVELPRLAAASGRPLADVTAALRRHPGVEWDEQGRLVGFGMTLRPTSHRVTLDAGTLYAWCASDTLWFPAILGRPAVIESACPVTGLPIRIEVVPGRVERVDPPEAVVSVVRPRGRVEDIRLDICQQGHFFRSGGAAREWLTKHPEARLRSIEEDFALASRATRRLGWSTSQ